MTAFRDLLSLLCLKYISKLVVLIAPLFLLAVMLPNVVYADNLVDAVVKGMTQFKSDTPEFKAAADQAQKLTTDQAGQAVQRLIDDGLKNSQNALTTVLNLATLADLASGHLIEAAYGHTMGKAIEKAFDNLLTVLRDPLGPDGATAIFRELQKMGIDDIQKQQDIWEALVARRNQLDEAGKKTNSPQAQVRGQVSFNAQTGELAFTDVTISSILGQAAGDPLVGASFDIW